MVRLGLRLKLFGGFGIVLCLLVLVGGIGLRNTTDYASALRYMHANTLVTLAELVRAEGALNELRIGGVVYARAGDGERANIKANEARWLAEIDLHISTYEKTDLQPEEFEHLATWRESYAAYVAARARGTALVDAGHDNEGAAVLWHEVGPAFYKAHDALDQLIAIQEKQAAQIDAEVTAMAETSSRVLLGSIGLALVFGLGLATFVSRRVGELHGASERRRAEAEALAADLATSEAKLRVVYEAIACGIVMLTDDGKVAEANPAAEAILGYRVDDLRGRHVASLWAVVNEDGSSHPIDQYHTTWAKRAFAPSRNQILGIHRPDGQRLWLQVDAVPLPQPDGAPPMAVVSLVDMTERRQMDEALRMSEARSQRESQRLLALHRASTVLAAQTAEPDAVLEEVLRSAVSLIGASSGSLYRWDAEAELLRCVRNFRVSPTHATPDVAPGKGLAGRTFVQAEPVVVNDYRNWDFALDSARVGGMRTGLGVRLTRSGKCLGVLILRSYGEDATQFSEEDARLAALFADQAAAALFTADAFELQRRVALHDALTELPNRVLLNDRLQMAIESARRDGSTIALMVMDLDRFKDINDTLGHAAGDVLLQEVAARISRTLRASDTVARLGGDEFALVLPDVSEEAACMAANRLLQMVKEPFLHVDHLIDVGASLGIAMYPQHGDDAATLLRRADVAMYAAKRGHRGAVVYASDQDQHSLNRLALVSDLRRGIERDELVLYFQPKVDFGSGSVTGAEALVRWRHPQSGLLAPDEFIPLAEQTGLIEPLTRWVLESALRQCRAWRETGIDLPVSVNLSMRNLHDRNLPRLVSELLYNTQVAPQRLQLEVTESAIMADPTRAREVLGELRAIGLEVAVDDFGTGHASLSYLKQLPLDVLKIDKSFVRDLAVNTSDRAIVRSTIELGHELGLAVTAEGVEDQAGWDLLDEMGCDMAQGYYLSRPLPAAEFERWLRQSSLWSAPHDRAA
jgi:diguanylate cyclase (GGDEF)-like protein/PAS domain S-box-containing protein